jgi:2-C-methyl-D-erythritol 2,4-cyclodiphosphate synthase
LNPSPTRRSARTGSGCPSFRIGLGFDAHELTSGRRLVLGGVSIPSKLGLAGHSDADVLLHALTDALLGSAALSDIGTLFPDTDPTWRGAASGPMLEKAYAMVKAQGYQLANADCTLVCDQPRLQPYYSSIRDRITGILDVSPGRIGLKAKTTEGTQLALKRKSIAAMAVVLVTSAKRQTPNAKRRSAFGSSALGLRRSDLR